MFILNLMIKGAIWYFIIGITILFIADIYVRSKLGKALKDSIIENVYDVFGDELDGRDINNFVTGVYAFFIVTWIFLVPVIYIRHKNRNS